MKGIVLAGGKGARLYPTTIGVSKHLLPIYDKPMIYYPLSVLMLAKIRDVLVITTSQHIPAFVQLLQDGSQFGMNIQYAVQDSPDGVAKAITIGRDFIGKHPVCTILGDNLFYGQGFTPRLLHIAEQTQTLGGATIFSYPVQDPKSFGVVEFDQHSNVLSLEEKPQQPKSKHAITGLYFYENSVIDVASEVRPSGRGEYEITDVNQYFLEHKKLRVEQLGRGFTWLDTGTVDNLLEASHFVETIEKRQGYKVACLEEIAYANGWIDHETVLQAGRALKNTSYGSYLISI